MLMGMLVLLAVVRSGIRLRKRTGGLGAGLLLASNFYISKLPMTIGQIGYWVRSLLKREPRQLIEYR